MISRLSSPIAGGSGRGELQGGQQFVVAESFKLLFSFDVMFELAGRDWGEKLCPIQSLWMVSQPSLLVGPIPNCPTAVN